MNIQSHYKMGTFVMNPYLIQQGRIGRLAFLFGNLRPDLLGGFFLLPHSAAARSTSVNKKIEDCIRDIASARPGKLRTDIQLGIICHFLADFFCYPHNDLMGKNPRVHCSYEYAIWKQLKATGINGSSEIMPAGGADEIIKLIWDKHREYSLSPSVPERDILFTADVCRYLLGSVEYIASLSRCEQAFEAAPAIA